MDYYFVGTAPFCDGNGEQCTETPGFEDAGDSKCGNGACCWTGTKKKCAFNTEKWKKSMLYRELMSEQGDKMKDIIPGFSWFGNAPFCGASPCDVLMAGMIPIKNSRCGDGSCCWTGEKWLGMRPLLKKHHDLLGLATKECIDFAKVREQTLQAGLKLGGDIVGAFAGGKK